MSNNYTNPATLEANENVPALNTQETLSAPETKESKKSSVATRIFAAILAALSVAVIFLPIKVLKGFAAEDLSLLNALKDLFGSGSTTKLFGVLPSFAVPDDTVGLIAGVVLFVFLLLIALSLVFSLIAVFSGKTGILYAANYFFMIGFGAYAACTYTVTAYKGEGGVIDFVCLGAAAAGALLYFVLSLRKTGKHAWANLVQCILSAVFSVALVLTFINCKPDFVNGVDSLKIAAIKFKLVAVILTLFAILNMILGLIRLGTKKGITFDFVRFALQFLFAVVICYIAIASKAKENTILIYAIVAAAAAILQIVVSCLQMKSAKKAKAVAEEETKAEEAPQAVEYVVEEYADAIPYEGGPVDGVEVAQEATPTFEEQKAENPTVQPAGYDFYNSKSFDPFIASLNDTERAQFTELFILKYKGVMPEIPDYVVGGDNKEFFRKIFIYLGQYRDRIPDGLLAKIYQFAIRF